MKAKGETEVEEQPKSEQREPSSEEREAIGD